MEGFGTIRSQSSEEWPRRYDSDIRGLYADHLVSGSQKLRRVHELCSGVLEDGPLPLLH